jgi:hypothetical protein
MSSAYGPGAEPAVLAAPRLRRRPSRLLLVGVLLGALGMLAGWVAYQQATDRTPVVAVAREVAFGQEITAADVRQVSIPGGTELRTIPWDDVDSVVGRRAATDLYPGQTVPPDAVRGGAIPAVGDAVIGMPVGPGQLPATPLTVRDEVLVIRADDAAAAVRATVLQVGAADSSGRRTVDLLVPEGQVAGLAQAATDDRALLVLVARR